MNQKKSGKKKKPVIVEKPMLRGRIIEKNAARRSLRVVGTILIMLFVYLIFGSMLMIDNMLLRIVANVALLGACGSLFYMNGATNGESDAAFSEIMYQRKQDNGSVDSAEAAKCFNPLKGFFTAFLGALPIFIVAVVLAIFAQPQVYSLGVLPSWVQGFERQANIGAALLYYHNDVSMSAIDIVRLVARLSILPFITMFDTGTAASLLLERLSPLLCLLVPMGYGLGYMRGKMLRAQVHTSIAANKRKRKRKEQRQRQQRKAKEPERLV